MKKRILAILMSVALLLNAGYAMAEAQPVEETAELFGSPWINSTVIGNLPEEAPALKDDFYAGVNYDILAAAGQAGAFYSPVQAASAELQTALISLITDENATGNELAQLKIFWEQAGLDRKT